MELESIVLLENKQSVLPLSINIGSVALIGPQVDRVSVCPKYPVPWSATHCLVHSSVITSSSTHH